jgi:trimeric autotransporter adhesin
VLTSSSAVGNQWLLNGVAVAGATGVTYTVSTSTQSGIYTVTTTVGGCTSAPSAPQTITVVGTKDELTATVGFHLFPNPTADARVTLEIAATPQPQPLTVFDALGRAVQTITVPAGVTMHTLDIRTLPAGVYSVRVITPAGSAVRRLVRE